MPVDPREQTARQKRLRDGYTEIARRRRESRQTGSIPSPGGGGSSSSGFVLLRSLAGDDDYQMKGREVTVSDVASGTFSIADSDSDYYAAPFVPRSYYTYFLCSTPSDPPDSATVLPYRTMGGAKYVMQVGKLDLLNASAITVRSGCGI